MEIQEAEPKEETVSEKFEGGYECKFTEEKEILFQTECQICLLVLREPYQVVCCGKRFCRVCIEKIKADNQSCPNCKKENFQSFCDKGFQQTLNQMVVHCTHKKQGCEWTGELGELDNHLNLDPQQKKHLEGCFYAEIDCCYKFAGCEMRLPRRNLRSHMEKAAQHHLGMLETRYEAQESELTSAKKEIAKMNETWSTKLNKVEENLNKKISDMEENIREQFPTPPIKFTMSNISYYKKGGPAWFSPHFYTKLRGYKVCLRVDAGKISKQGYLSVRLCMVRGEFDNDLKWPCREIVTVEVQEKDNPEEKKNAPIFYCSRTDNYGMNLKVPDDKEKLEGGFGTRESVDFLGPYELDKFVKNDSIEFIVS